MAEQPFEIEALISRDIIRQIEEAQRDELYGYHEAAIHRCKTAKQFCQSLISRLNDIIKKKGD